MEQHGLRPEDVRALLSVPVWIDELREIQEQSFVRAAYFAVEATEPTEGGNLPLEGVPVPFIAIGLTAALCQPNSTTTRFETADSISELLDRVEASERYSVETADLWLPCLALGPADRKPGRGDVYRVDASLLAAGIRFRTGRTALAEYIEECRRMVRPAIYSSSETTAFAGWARREIQGAVEDYSELERKGLVLQWDDRRQVRQFKPRSDEGVER